MGEYQCFGHTWTGTSDFWSPEVGVEYWCFEQGSACKFIVQVPILLVGPCAAVVWTEGRVVVFHFRRAAGVAVGLQRIQNPKRGSVPLAPSRKRRACDTFPMCCRYAECKVDLCTGGQKS